MRAEQSGIYSHFIQLLVGFAVNKRPDADSNSRNRSMAASEDLQDPPHNFPNFSQNAELPQTASHLLQTAALPTKLSMLPQQVNLLTVRTHSASLLHRETAAALLLCALCLTNHQCSLWLGLVLAKSPCHSSLVHKHIPQNV